MTGPDCTVTQNLINTHTRMHYQIICTAVEHMDEVNAWKTNGEKVRVVL